MSLTKGTKSRFFLLDRRGGGGGGGGGGGVAIEEEEDNRQHPRISYPSRLAFYLGAQNVT